MAELVCRAIAPKFKLVLNNPLKKSKAGLLFTKKMDYQAEKFTSAKKIKTVDLAQPKLASITIKDADDSKQPKAEDSLTIVFPGCPNFPKKLGANIFRNLTYSERALASRVCKSWNQILQIEDPEYGNLVRPTEVENMAFNVFKILEEAKAFNSSNTAENISILITLEKSSGELIDFSRLPFNSKKGIESFSRSLPQGPSSNTKYYLILKNPKKSNFSVFIPPRDKYTYQSSGNIATTNEKEFTSDKVIKAVTKMLNRTFFPLNAFYKIGKKLFFEAGSTSDFFPLDETTLRTIKAKLAINA